MARQTIVISNRIESNLVLTAALEYSSLGLHFGSSTVHQRGGASENSGEMVGWGTQRGTQGNSGELMSSPRRTQGNSDHPCWGTQWGTQEVPPLCSIFCIF